MNEVVVGVKRIKNGSELAYPHEEASAALQCLWVTIGGKEVPSDYIISAEAVSENAPLVVTIRVGASEFRTADAFGPDAPERFRERAKVS